jgi:hypothetical protein
VASILAQDAEEFRHCPSSSLQRSVSSLGCILKRRLANRTIRTGRWRRSLLKMQKSLDSVPARALSVSDQTANQSSSSAPLLKSYITTKWAHQASQRACQNSLSCPNITTDSRHPSSFPVPLMQVAVNQRRPSLNINSPKIACDTFISTKSNTSTNTCIPNYTITNFNLTFRHKLNFQHNTVTSTLQDVD